MDFLSTPWGFGSVAIAAVSLLLIVWRVGTVSLSKAGFHIGKYSSVKVSPHATCPHAGDIMELIHRTTEYMEKRQEMKLQLLEDQMRFYEETEEEIIGFLSKLFIGLLFDKLEGIDTYIQHPEYSAYMVTLKAIAADIKSYVRSCFKGNHYAEATPEVQRVYVNKKKDVTIQKVTDALNMYWRGSIVTRANLYDKHQENMPKFEGYVSDIFNKAFTLARESDGKLQKMEEAYKGYVNYTLGKG
jgi:hypothetical protein